MIGCPSCGGNGIMVEYEDECCGHYLDTGECCSAIYGMENVQLVAHEYPCEQCGGFGEVERYR